MSTRRVKTPVPNRPDLDKLIPTDPSTGVCLSREIADEMIHSLINALHAQVFGVHSFNDPSHSHDQLADGGEIHETVHALIRLLPPRRMTTERTE